MTWQVKSGEKKKRVRKHRQALLRARRGNREEAREGFPTDKK